MRFVIFVLAVIFWESECIEVYPNHGLCKDVNIMYSSSPTECARECEGNALPKVCYYQFTVESYSVLGQACSLCSPDRDNHLLQNCQCVANDGVERSIFTINRMIPGPSIQVCKGDKVVVDVLNKLPGQGVSIHFHGIKQLKTPYSDGVPFVTQCPINEGNTFRYQWIADSPGTFLYHSHSGFQKVNGVYGSIVVRQSIFEEEARDLYDYDLTSSVILISDTFHILGNNKFPGRFHQNRGQLPDNILINGKGQFSHRTKYFNISTITPLENIYVDSGYSYRFRLINAMCTVCPAQFTIEGHKLTVIATDGNPIEPVEVDSIISFAGERYDFILAARQTAKPYWIQVKGLLSCAETKIQQLGILTYTGAGDKALSKPPTYTKGLSANVVLNPLDRKCADKPNGGICVSDLKSKVENKDLHVLHDERPNVQIFLSFKLNVFNTRDLFVSEVDKYRSFLVGPRGIHVTPTINGISFRHPPSPLISQFNHINNDIICNDYKRPNGCITNCSCVHLIRVPLNAIVELVLVDELGIPNLHHPFHLHGHVFKVVADGVKSDNKAKMTADYFKRLDEQGMINRVSMNATYKDVVVVPNDGYAVVRFRAFNPGFWMMHCHFLYHQVTGMSVVVWVGELSDLPPVPADFPKCGDFIPPVSNPGRSNLP